MEYISLLFPPDAIRCSCLKKQSSLPHGFLPTRCICAQLTWNRARLGGGQYLAPFSQARSFIKTTAWCSIRRCDWCMDHKFCHPQNAHDCWSIINAFSLTWPKVLSLSFGFSVELCLSCTGDTKVDELLDILDNYFGINLCLAKIDGFYFPFDGRMQVSDRALYRPYRCK